VEEVAKACHGSPIDIVMAMVMIMTMMIIYMQKINPKKQVDTTPILNFPNPASKRNSSSTHDKKIK